MILAPQTQSQSFYVSAAHRYWNFQWSEAKNRATYGTQASSEGVGSNFLLEIGVHTTAPSDLDFTSAIGFLKARVDHQCLFADIPEFRAAPSTLETITQYLAANLFQLSAPAGGVWSHLTVRENENLGCTVLAKDLQCQVAMRVRVLNLELEVHRPVDPDSGLAMERTEVWSQVRAIAHDFAEPFAGGETAWAEALNRALQIKVKGLSELRIDLGSQRFLRVRS